MKLNYRPAILSLLTVATSLTINAQRAAHSYMKMKAAPAGSVPLAFSTATDITQCKIPDAPVRWGMDTAWDSEDNVRRGTNFITTDILSQGIGRVSFQPSDLVVNGELSDAQKGFLQSRLDHIALTGTKNLNINCDHEKLNATNYGSYKNWNVNHKEWYNVIKATVKYCQSKGFNVVSVSPFNEPDYTAWNEGRKADFYKIAELLYKDPELAGIRICGGNTLNCDEGLPWYNYLKAYLSEGNTHQLAGSFDNYAKFWQTVRADGKVATADELHNTTEAFVGVHYGMQNGIWWGFEGMTRGEYCKISTTGKEIGYAENRSAWTAAAIYKRPEGRIDAFCGGSERQATTSTFSYVATDRPVYYGGYGPSYTYAQTVPGGTGYGAEGNQPNFDRVMPIYYGEDVPYDEFTSSNVFVIANRKTQMVMTIKSGSINNGTAIVQDSYSGSSPQTYQRWIIDPVSLTKAGDGSCFHIRSYSNKGMMVDVNNYTLEDGGDMIIYAGNAGNQEQFYMEYAGDGDFYIRSNHSGLYLQPKNNLSLAQIVQRPFTGEELQRWHFMADTAPYKWATSPSAPKNPVIKARNNSIYLSWSKSLSAQAYNVQRSSDGGATWDVVGRMVTGLEFIDNDVRPGVEYSYRIKSVNKSRFQSVPTEVIKATVAGKRSLTARYCFDNNLQDATENILDAVTANTAAFNNATPMQGTHYFNMPNDGKGQYLQVPAVLADSRQMTIALWAKMANYDKTWVRIFDFGNGQDQYMFLTANGDGEMRFVMKNGGTEQILRATKVSDPQWHHYAVTLANDKVTLYVDGKEVGSTNEITIRLSDFHPAFNYFGRSQFAADPLMAGGIDDVQIYNAAITAADVVKVMNGGVAEFQDILGDVNYDGKVDLLDANIIIDYVLNPSTAIDTSVADVNADGKVTVADANMIVNQK